MSFDNDKNLTNLYQDCFLPTITKLGLIPVRIDHLHHIDLIDSKIINEIRESRCMIADLTKNKGGVYFEAGYAKGLDIPIFFTCIKAQQHTIHFDLAHYNTLFWEEDKFDNFKSELYNRIKVILKI
jgi:nucleoside 2-deoxyribosyltransferase